jgi:hypothetical protein
MGIMNPDHIAKSPSTWNELARKFMASMAEANNRRYGRAWLKHRGEKAKAAKPRKKRH